MSGDDLADRIDDLVHRETQVHDAGVDLTVATVESITAPARVDFGGGELTDVETVPVETARRSPEDDYGWWNLTGGAYLLEYNESLAGDEPLLLQPRVELVERGISHPTLRLSELPRVPISVPPAGLRLKENARISTLVPE